MRRALPLAAALLSLALSRAAASPVIQVTNFQVSDCRGDGSDPSFRINPVSIDTGMPQVQMAVIDLNPGLNTGQTYPAVGGDNVWPKRHVTASGMTALWRGGSHEGVANRGVSGYGASYNNGYSAAGSATGLVVRNLSSGKSSGLSYPEQLPYTAESIGGKTMTLYGSCSYAYSSYGPSNDTPSGQLAGYNRGDPNVRWFGAVLPTCYGYNFYYNYDCGVYVDNNGGVSRYGIAAGNCPYTSYVVYYDGGTGGATFSNFLTGSCGSIHNDSGAGGDVVSTFVHDAGGDEQFYEFYNCSVPSYTSDVFGNSQGAWGFDGSQSQKIQRDDGASYTLSDATFDAWVYAGPASLSGRHAISGQGWNNTDVYLGTYNGYWAFWMGNGSTVKYLLSEAPAVANTWTYITGTYEHPNVQHPSAGRMRFYVNGLEQLQSGSTYDVAWSWSNNAGYPYILGGTPGGDYFTGRIMEAGIWARQLLPQEVAAEYDPTVFQFTTGGQSAIQLPAAYQFGPSSLFYYVDSNGNTISAPQGATTIQYMRSNHLPLLPGSNNFVEFVAQDTQHSISYSQPFQVSVATASPNAPSAVSAAGVDNSTVRFAWNQDYVCNPHSYDVVRTVNPGTTPLYAASDIPAHLQPYTTSYVQTGLGVNQPAGLQVRTKTMYGSSSLTAVTTGYTLANAPSGLTLLWVGLSSAAFRWNANGNPAYTPYEFSQSVNDTGFNPVKTSTPVVFNVPYVMTVATVTGLSAATTYYFRVRAQNGNGGYPGGGQATVYDYQAGDTLTPFPTLPVAPSLSATAVSTGSITWNWLPEPTVQGYVIADAQGNSQCNAASPTFDLGSNAAFCGNLANMTITPNLRVGLRVRASNLSGSSGLSPVVWAFTLADPPLGLSVVSTSSNAISLAWDGNGNPGNTSYQLAASLDPAFSATATSTITVTGPAASFPGLLPGTSYFFHVRAVNGDGVPTTIASLGTSAVTPVPSDQAQGLLTSTGTVVTGSDGRTRVVVASGTLTTSATIYVSVNPLSQPIVADPSRLTRTLSLSPQGGYVYAPGTSREFVALVNSQVSSSPFSSPVTIYLPYSDIVRPGIVDNTDPPIQVGTLRVYTLDPYIDQWTPLPSSLDVDNHRVRASTTHFSVFALFGLSQQAAADTSKLKVFPQPWRPGSGGPFDSATLAGMTGLVFNNLPLDGAVTVYTLAGERVAALNAVADGTGTYSAVWDGTNQSGKKVVSGVYLARVSGGTGKAKVVKIAIER